MVQLPATAAIEYVAAGHFFPGSLLIGGTFGRGDFWPEGFLSGRAFVRRGGFCPGCLLAGGTFVFLNFLHHYLYRLINPDVITQ